MDKFENSNTNFINKQLNILKYGYCINNKYILIAINKMIEEKLNLDKICCDPYMYRHMAYFIC